MEIRRPLTRLNPASGGFGSMGASGVPVGFVYFLFEFSDSDFEVLNFPEPLIVCFFELVEVKYQVCILFHFPFGVELFGLEQFLIPSRHLHQGLLNMY